MFGPKNPPGMEHLIELHSRGLLNVVFGVGKKQVNSGRALNSLRFWWFVLWCHVSMQVSLQLMITLSFAALSVFGRSGRGNCGPVPFGENPTTNNNIVDRKIRLYVLSLAESSV